MDGLTAAEAARRLGVKPATLYAYVSRGVLRRRRGPDGRSRFDPAEVEALARRGRPRRRPDESELVIESALTALGDDRPYYRGRDALALAASWQLEDVAGWLWTGEPWSGTAWRGLAPAVAAGRAAQAGLPADVLPLERLQVIVPALAAVDPLRHNLDPSVVVTLGQQLIAGMVDCLPGADPDGPIAARLSSALMARPAPEIVDVVRVALVLLADHELAASTLAARVAASASADPYAAVMAGLGGDGRRPARRRLAAGGGDARRRPRPGTRPPPARVAAAARRARPGSRAHGLSRRGRPSDDAARPAARRGAGPSAAGGRGGDER